MPYNTKKVNLLIVDDSSVTRNGLKMLLSIDKSIQVTGEAADGLEALNLIRNNEYDVIIMDINMPNIDGVKATKEITAINKNAKILTNSCNVSPYYVLAMIKAGASGYITKGDDHEDYVEAIRTICNGGIYLSDGITEETYNTVFKDLKLKIV